MQGRASGEFISSPLLIYNCPSKHAMLHSIYPALHPIFLRKRVAYSAGLNSEQTVPGLPNLKINLGIICVNIVHSDSASGTYLDELAVSMSPKLETVSHAARPTEYGLE